MQQAHRVDGDLSTRHASVREVFWLALPIIISMASASILGLVDTFFMGWVGAGAQAAVGLGAPTVFSLLSLFFGTITGLTTFVSQYFGAGKYSDCGRMLWHVLPASFIVGGICALTLNPLVMWILMAMGTNPEIIGDAYAYMSIRIYASPIVFVSFALLSFLRGIGDMKTPAIVTGIAVIINIPLTYIFTFGWMGIPAYGAAGAAIGTVLSQAVEMLLYAYVVMHRKNADRYMTRKFVRLKLKTYAEFCKVSLPVGVCWGIEHAGWVIFGLYIASLSKEDAAAHAIVQSFMNLAFMPGLAISIAATTLVGQYLGAGNPKSAEKSARYSVRMSMGALVSLGLIFFILRYIIADGFSDDPAVIQIAANLFIFVAVYQVFDAMGVTLSGALRGAGDTRFPMFIMLGCIWLVMVPLVYILGDVCGFGLYGAWSAGSLAIILMGLCYYARFKTGKWKTMGLMSAQPEAACCQSGNDGLNSDDVEKIEERIEEVIVGADLDNSALKGTENDEKNALQEKKV